MGEKHGGDLEVLTRKGRVPLTRNAAVLLIDGCLRNDPALGPTFDAFDRGLAGFPVEIPPDELDTFRDKLAAYLGRFSPLERSNEIQQLDQLLRALEP